MREIHARCVKISRIGLGCGKSFRGFIGISAKIRLALTMLKKISEIWLTAGVIQVECANCPRTENVKTTN